MNAGHAQGRQDVIHIGQMEVIYLQEAGNGSQTGCFELRVPPGSNVPPPHSHSDNEELVYVLDGTLRYTVGSETRDLQSGETMSTPRGAVHGFSNPHSEMARALVILTPDTIGPQYFREVGAIVNAGGPPDRAKLASVMKTYGLVPALPVKP
jgi:quercetin dioxygenase-like cupin family protein